LNELVFAEDDGERGVFDFESGIDLIPRTNRLTKGRRRRTIEAVRETIGTQPFDLSISGKDSVEIDIVEDIEEFFQVSDVLCIRQVPRPVVLKPCQSFLLSV